MLRIGRGTEVPPLHLTELQIGRQSRSGLKSRHFDIGLLPEGQAGRRKIGLQRRRIQQARGAARVPLRDAGLRRWIPVPQFHAERRRYIDAVTV